MPIRAILLLLFILGSIPFCFIRPFYGILVWTVLAFLNPQAYVWSAATRFPWALAVAIPTLLGCLFFCRNWSALASAKVALIAALGIWFTFTAAVSTSTPIFIHHAADTWDKWQFVSKILMMTVVAILVTDSFERLRLLVLSIAGTFGLFVLKILPFVILTGGAFRVYGPANSMIADNNDFGLALNMSAPLFFFLAQTESHPWVRRLFGFLFVITIPAVFFTYSRGALVGLMAVLLVMFLQSRRRLLLIPVAAVAVLIAILFAPESWRQRMNPDNALDNSARERLNAWSFARNLAADYPITGGGFATFTPELFARYAPNTGDIHGPHSVYFGLLGEHGYVGLCLYGVLLFNCLFGARRLIREARRRGDQAVMHYSNMFRLSIIGFMASGTFLGRAYFDYFFSMVACLAILDTVARERWQLQDAAEDSEQEDEEPRDEQGDLSLPEGTAVV